MAKLKLPFELEKPSTNEFVTQASQIGHGNKNVSEELDDFGEKVGSLKTTVEEGFYLCDPQGNVVMQFTADGFDVVSFVTSLKRRELSQADTVQEGFYITDNSGNVMFSLDSNGVNFLASATLINYLQELIGGSVEIDALKPTVEEGFYVTDSSGNVMLSLNSSGVNFLATSQLITYLNSIIEGGGGTEYDAVGYPVLDNNNPLARLITGRSRACIFASWGVIGASFETGYMDVKLNGATAHIMDVGYEWPTLFGQMNSVTIGNFALPGTPLRNWLSSANGLAKLQAADAMEAYVLNMSSNDCDINKYNEPVGNIATDIDYNNPDNNAQTWVGCLATAIQKIRIKSPRCYIFAATVRKYTTNRGMVNRINPYAQAVRDICGCFENVFLIDMWAKGLDWTTEQAVNEYMMGLHPTRNGHIYLSDAFNTYIDWIIRKNPTAMRNASFVGTDYQDLDN